MKFRFLLPDDFPSCSRQVLFTAVCIYVFFNDACKARIDRTHPLRWLSRNVIQLRSESDLVDGSDPAIEADLDLAPNPPPSRQVQSSTDLAVTDLIPKVDRLSFVDDLPIVLRFYAPGGAPLQTTASREDGSREPLAHGVPPGESTNSYDKKCQDLTTESSGRHRFQGAVAGVSFVGGLAISMSLCLVCFRIRRKLASRLCHTRHPEESGADSTSEEAKMEP